MFILWYFRFRLELKYIERFLSLFVGKAKCIQSYHRN